MLQLNGRTIQRARTPSPPIGSFASQQQQKERKKKYEAMGKCTTTTKKKPQGIQENKVVKKNRIERWRKRFTAREMH